jgi:hypothetical protein
MKKLSIKNLVIEVADIKRKEDYENAIYNALASASPEAGYVNLVKVKVADIPLDKLQCILQHIEKDLTKQGLTNCVFVPIHPQGIQDITIEKLEWTDEERV